MALGILDLLLGGRSGRKRPARSIRKETVSALRELVQESRHSPEDSPWAGLEAAQRILAAPPEDQIESIHACFAYLGGYSSDLITDTGAKLTTSRDWHMQGMMSSLAGRLLSRKLPFTDEDFASLLGACHVHSYILPIKAVVRAVEVRLGGGAPPEPLREAIGALREALGVQGAYTDIRKLRERLERLISGSAPATPALEPVDSWTIRMCEILPSMNDEERGNWRAIITHSMKATSARPTKNWMREAEALLATIGNDSFVETIGQVLDCVGAKAPFPVKVPSHWVEGERVDGDPHLVSDRFADCLRGLIWAAGITDDTLLIPVLGNTAERCFKKLRGYGPLAPKVGNACLNALCRFSSMDSVGQLMRLKTRVRHASVRKQVEKALTVAADNAGLSTGDLEEIAVPTCGLTGIGFLSLHLGGFEALLEVKNVHGTTLSWRREDGKTQKSIPAKVKSEFPEDLKRLKGVAAEVKSLLPAQRDRLERMLLTRRTLPLEQWRSRYLDHPLVGYLTRRLIWSLGDDDGRQIASCETGRLTDIDGRELSLSDSTPVRLWHPIDSPVETVSAWRERLGARELTQPFKQAHREIYLLTDAERRTETYSNRFAAHILKQHQFNALLQQRGWRYTLQGGWDSHNTPFIDLPDLGWRVEFWIDPAGDLEAEMSEAGIYLYVATDQVRFLRLREDGPQPLHAVPPILFSEMLRDVDLFVGVCSVGNDPAWQDGGPGGHYADYWSGYAFGELSETAKTRRETLEYLVPRLKIADRCTLDRKYLTVRGDLRTYHIHLGSGNIRMSPNDQYLCIVTGRRADKTPADVMLPFEGDSMLSIILSKAFLLAGDKKIEDPTIVNQIKSS